MSGPHDSRGTYNTIYRAYASGRPTSDVSLRNLTKAIRRVDRVCRAFDICLDSERQKVLDVGCGLGFYTKALTLTEANVTGLDVSDEGVDLARRSFPECTFLRGLFPTDVPAKAEQDLIWAVDLSLLNTFDVRAISRDFVEPALTRLRSGGAIVIGWHTDFSGRTIDNWAHWARDDFDRLHQECGFSPPRTLLVDGRCLENTLMRACQWARRAAPVFLVLRKN